MAHAIAFVILPSTLSNPTKQDVNQILKKFRRRFDYFEIGGSFDGMMTTDPKLSKPSFFKKLFSGDPHVLTRNSCMMSKLPKDIVDPYYVVLPNRKLISEEKFSDENFNPYSDEASQRWIAEIERLRDEYADNYCVLVDVHV